MTMWPLSAAMCASAPLPSPGRKRVSIPSWRLARSWTALATEAGDVLITELGDEIAVEGGTSQSVLGGFGPIFSGVVESLAWSRSELQVKVRDARLRLERPVQRNSYGGSLGVDGTLEMQGLTKPLAFGRCTGTRACVGRSHPVDLSVP